ncbi:MAG: hypothetical protein RLZZ299_375 [Pseudomonadota bacterium]|jgi:hypothetical protein
MTSRLLLLPAMLLLSGCAVRAGVRLVSADHALDAALEAGGEDAAIYETTLARAYLEKAREEAGHADYGAAETLARQARAFAESARRKAAASTVPDDVEGLDDASRPRRKE